RVDIWQTYNSKTTAYSVVTDDNGEYTLDLKSAKTYASFRAPESVWANATREIEIAADAANTLDLVIPRSRTYRIHADLFIKYAGGDWQGPLEMNSVTARQY